MTLAPMERIAAEKVRLVLDACSQNDAVAVRAIVEGSSNLRLVSQQDESTGISPLMIASQVGNVELVQYLLNEGAPWNAIDRNGKCAGDYATESERWNIVQLLVEWGTRSELILGTAQREVWKQQHQQQALAQQPVHESSTKPNYLNHRLQYNEDGTALLDEDNDAVMMAWERPIMKAHASILLGDENSNGGGNSTITSATSPTRPRHRRVLNVGFGMGIIDSILQEYKPSFHVIIEAHPQVYQNMLKAKWDQKSNVRLCHGRWQDVVPKLIHEGVAEFDAIFYDTYAEHAYDMEDFHSYLPKMLCKRQGVYSFFNGLAPDNLFFHGVGDFVILKFSPKACNVVKLQLSQLGFDCEYLQCQIEANNDKVWDGVRRKYWHNRDTYYLPQVTWNQEFLGRKNKANGAPTIASGDDEMEIEQQQGAAKHLKTINYNDGGLAPMN